MYSLSETISSNTSLQW